MENILNIILDFLKNNIKDVVWIIILYLTAKIILKKIIKKLIHFIDDGDETKSKREKRAKTLGKVVISIGRTVIYGIILLMTLSLFNIDITPILAGIGIIGLAVGFGAQSLVKSFVAGLFILLENQYNIGDKVKIGAFEGKVIKITLHSTVLRANSGEKIYVANNNINNVVNFSQKRKKK